MAFINLLKKQTAAAAALAGVNSAFRANSTPSGTLIPAAGTWQTVIFDQEVFDKNNEFSDNLFCPVSSGEYTLHTRVSVLGIPSQEAAQARIIKNSEIIALGEFTLNTSKGVLDLDLEIAGTATAVSGDCFHIEVRQTDPLAHQTGTSGFDNFFEGWKIQIGTQGPQGVRGPAGFVASGTFVIDNLTPQIDGSGINFNLQQIPTSGTLSLFWNGVRQLRGVAEDYILSGSGITTCFIAFADNNLVAEYFV